MSGSLCHHWKTLARWEEVPKIWKRDRTYMQRVSFQVNCSINVFFRETFIATLKMSIFAKTGKTKVEGLHIQLF